LNGAPHATHVATAVWSAAGIAPVVGIKSPHVPVDATLHANCESAGFVEHGFTYGRLLLGIVNVARDV